MSEVVGMVMEVVVEMEVVVAEEMGKKVEEREYEEVENWRSMIEVMARYVSAVVMFIYQKSRFTVNLKT